MLSNCPLLFLANPEVILAVSIISVSDSAVADILQNHRFPFVRRKKGVQCMSLHGNAGFWKQFQTAEKLIWSRNEQEADR